MRKGDKFKLSFKVTPLLYLNFQKIFKDKNPIHTKKEFANKYGFDDKVMYGNILNGFISFFVGEGLPVKNVVLVSQAINYCYPVYMGETLDFESQIEDIHNSVGLVDFSFIFNNQRGFKIARGKIQIKILQ